MKRNIVLLCAAGMSTSILVRKIQEAAQAQEYACDVNAYSLSDAGRYVPDADVVLLGPQVRFNLSKLQTAYPDKKIAVIDMRDYGTMNGVNVVKTIRTLLNE